MHCNFRLKAFFIHLSASVVMGFFAVTIVYHFWYPAPLDVALGVTGVFLVLLLVDVVLGPLLTFVVCNPNKKSLKFDLFVIVCLQLTAFFYGMSVVAEGRPVWIVFNTDRFDLVQSYQIDHPYKDKADMRFRSMNWAGPVFVAAFAPTDTEANNQLTFDAVFAGIDIPQRPDLYKSYENSIQFVQRAIKPLGDLNKYNNPDLVKQILAKWPQADGFLPMMAKKKSMTVLLRKQTGAVLAVVELNPWP